jgi:hypothetical protein
MLWSDPLYKDLVKDINNIRIIYSNIEFEENFERKCSYFYGYKAIKTFKDVLIHK